MLIELNDYKTKSDIAVNDLMPSISMESLFHMENWQVYYLDSKGKFLDCNEESCQFLEIPKEEILNKTDADLPWKENAVEWRQNDFKVIKTQKSLEFSEEIIHKNSKYICTAVKLPVFTRKKVNGILALIKVKEKIPFLMNTINETKISKRESECLYYLIKGYNLKEIALFMKISPRTVEHHLNHSKIKLNCYRKSDLILKASQLSSIKNQLFIEAVNQLPEIKKGPTSTLSSS